MPICPCLYANLERSREQVMVLHQGTVKEQTQPVPNPQTLNPKPHAKSHSLQASLDVMLYGTREEECSVMLSLAVSLCLEASWGRYCLVRHLI